jgi:hypothetical protein
MRDEEEKMAIEYGAFIVDGLNVKKQTLSLAGQSIGFTDGEGFTGVQNGSEPLVFALARVVGRSSPVILTISPRPSC